MKFKIQGPTPISPHRTLSLSLTLLVVPILL